MAKRIDETSGCGGVAGFQVPLGVKKRKKKVDEMLSLNESISVAEAIAYFSGLDEESSKVVEGMLDENEYVKLAEMIKQNYAENALRHVIRKKVREVVRKKQGGEGYVLYAPNPGKKKGSKPVGEFPTKMAARRAELNRFPPKDPKKLTRMRKDLETLRKHPEKAAEKKPSKKEALELLAKSITESLFREEKKGSDWEEYVGKLSKQAVLADKTFQNLQKNIAKKSDKALKDAAGKAKSLLGPAGFEVKDKGVKKDVEQGVTYLEFYVGDSEGMTEVGPLYIAIDKGYPKIDVSDGARNAMTRLDPERSKALRAELMTFQEDVLDSFDDVAKATQKRDEYLTKMETKIDGFVADLNALEITMLKRILVEKYRKIS